MTTTRGTAKEMPALATMAGETMVGWLRDVEVEDRITATVDVEVQQTEAYEVSCSDFTGFQGIERPG